jgi:hypothetical protein
LTIRSRRRNGTYRFVPPEQVVARAVTYIGDVLLEFTLTLTGSVLVVWPDGEPGAEPLGAAALTAAALHRIVDGLFVSVGRGDRPTIESSNGHRFRHSGSSVPGPRTRRFAGVCTIDLPAAGDAQHPAVHGSLGYRLDVTAAAPSDPPMLYGGPLWPEHYERTLAAIGAIVLAPVPVTARLDHV